jgi:hypothetical protein
LSERVSHDLQPTSLHHERAGVARGHGSGFASLVLG